MEPLLALLQVNLWFVGPDRESQDSLPQESHLEKLGQVNLWHLDDYLATVATAIDFHRADAVLDDADKLYLIVQLLSSLSPPGVEARIS
jgi:hypothetical protein